MLNRLLGFLRGERGTKVSPVPSAPTPVPPPDAAQPPAAQWRSVDDPKNPFIVEGYDVLAFVNEMRSVTGDPKVAESFVTLRGSFGKEHVGKLPEGANRIECALAYPFNGDIADGAVFKAQAMEQKWDVYLYADRLYFCRSWTGTLVYVAEFTAIVPTVTITAVWAAPDPQTRDELFPIKVVDYLMKSHPHRLIVPHPLPLELKQQPELIPMYSFAQYGQRCCFGTFEDSMRSNIRKAPKPG